MSRPPPLLADADARRAALSAGLLTSDHDGEVVAAARACCGLLRKGGLDPAAVVAAGLSANIHASLHVTQPVAPHDVFRPRWQQRAKMARLSPHLNDWERNFLDDVITWKSLSERQEAALRSILIKSEGPRS